MSRINKLIPKLRKAPQPPLSHAGAPAEADRAKRPPLADPSPTGVELNPGDRVEGLADFGKRTGEFGTVEQTNEDDALVKWDDDGRMRLHQPWLKKVVASNKSTARQEANRPLVWQIGRREKQVPARQPCAPATCIGYIPKPEQI